MKSKIKVITITIVSLGIFLIGILIAFNQNLSARQAVFEEHDHHLTDLVMGADQNLNSAFELCEQEIESALKRESVKDAEKEFVLDNNSKKLERIIKEATLLSADYVNRIIVEKNNKLVISSIDFDSLNYIQVEKENSNKFRIYKEIDSGIDYLALSVKSSDYGLNYLVFLDIKTMYNRVISNSSYDDYWTVFYDEKSGLVIFNDKNTPTYMILSKDEIIKREDGLSLMLKAELEEKSNIESYIYKDDSGKENSARIAIIPSMLSENGDFIVSVAVFDGEKIKAMESILSKTILGTLLISISVSVAIYFLMNIKKREKKLSEEIELLEKENELTSNLLKRQEKLIHHQKLETIGIMTSGIAHEFNNMLSPIMSNSLLLLEKVPEDSELFSNGLEIYQTSLRAKELVSNISKLSRKSIKSEMHLINPNKLIDSVISLTKTSIKSNIEIKKDVKTNKEIMGDESQLSYMLINLCINAVQEMAKDGGILEVSSWDDNENIYFSVSDTGHGIPEYAFPNLFNPFFTTKETGKGTGLGLAIALRAANDHGGTITAENKATGGAKFTVTIPLKFDNIEE